MLPTQPTNFMLKRLESGIFLSGKPFSYPSEVEEMLASTVSELCAVFSALQETANNLSMHIAGRDF